MTGKEGSDQILMNFNQCGKTINHLSPQLVVFCVNISVKCKQDANMF